MKNLSRQERRSMERKFAKAGKMVATKQMRSLQTIGVFYKDDSTDGFSITINRGEAGFDALVKAHELAVKTYDVEAEACVTGSHPDYVGVTMEEVINDTIDNMHTAIRNWNNKVYGGTRKMGFHSIEWSPADVAEELTRITLGVVYGEKSGRITNDNFNGMYFIYEDMSTGMGNTHSGFNFFK